MKVQLIAVGTRMPQWVQEGYADYAKRLPKELAPQLVEIALGHRGKSAAKQATVEAEGEAVLRAAPGQALKVALDLGGKSWSTEELAEQMSQWMMAGRDLSFLIGGPDGLSDECLAQTQVKWSLSRLTLPHPLVRIVFIEQWYRAWTILRNHPYHK